MLKLPFRSPEQLWTAVIETENTDQVSGTIETTWSAEIIQVVAPAKLVLPPFHPDTVSFLKMHFQYLTR